ncbi:FecR family protein [Allosphingosinicella deserti]|uniref:FecR family protein n=1 Tax=Allosphingosinicella deserti TaxID=2116704 RepID=UPI001304B9A9|nr:FecR domain-containing protein [Sphingomonas deserti]
MDEGVRGEAVAWLVALRSPDGADHHASFEQWYASDPRHADIYDELLANWEKMALAEHLAAATAPAAPGARSAYRRRTTYALAAAASLVLLVFCIAAWLRLAELRPGDTVSTAIATRTGEIQTIRLADGSRVVVDTVTVLSVAYTQSERRLTLKQGRARFDVAHDMKRPFVVDAAGGTVTALGTLFDVDVQGPKAVVSLLRGLVEVRSAGALEGRRTADPSLLQPGQRVALDASRPVGLPTRLRPEDVRWPTGMLSFVDAPLTEVAAAANRYTDIEIILSDREVGALRFSGTFRAGDAQGLARMLAATFDLDLASRNGALLLEPHRQTQK